ncbi:MAG: helix-turn-helix domain-containing protein [Erysipelotrichaceae bacterium]|nr:helix-turn-helix domain-containing protein [Erysipelotrichaceae bacterium]
MKNKDLQEIQEQFCSCYDKRKLCSYDVEFIDNATKPLIHQQSRFWFFLSGKALLTINGKQYPVKKNSMVAIMPWDTTIISNVKEPLHFIKIVYNSDFLWDARYTNNLSNRYLSLLNPISEQPVANLTRDESEKILAIMDDIKNEIGTESLYDVTKERELSDAYVSNKLFELIIEFIRFISKVDLKRFDGKSMELDDRPAIFKYIYSHISQNMTLLKLSELFYMSESSISKYITDVTGLTFSDLVNEMRITKTVDLLTYTDMPLSDVAQFVGFSDASHLIKVFTARMNLSPSQYREIYKAKEHIFREKDKSVSFEILSYVNSHFTEDIRISDLVERFHVSYVDVNRSLLYLVEKNFDDLLNYLRINKACQLLLTTDDAIIDIATAVGYNNVKTFHRSFIRLKNMTPGYFRKNINLQMGSESISEEEE